MSKYVTVIGLNKELPKDSFMHFVHKIDGNKYWVDSYKNYLILGTPHRNNAPAIIYPDGDKSWHGGYRKFIKDQLPL